MTPRPQTRAPTGGADAGVRRTLSPLGSDFNAFLFSELGDEGLRAPVSVASALARLDLDPWSEAASLAGMPRDAAASRLSGLMESLPDLRYSPTDAGATAARLIELLPVPLKGARSAETSWRRVAGVKVTWRLVAQCIPYALILALSLLVTQFLRGG